VRVRPGALVAVEERLDGRLHLKLKGAYLRYKLVDRLPYRGYYAANKSELKALARPSNGSSVPTKGHPWRKMGWMFKKTMQQEQISRQPTGHF